MKLKKIIKILGGLLIFLSTIFISIWFFSPKTAPPIQLSFESALIKIKNNEVSAIIVRDDTLELTTKSNEKFRILIDGSDSTRDQIFAAAKGTQTKIELETPSSGWGWIVLLNAIPLVILTGIFGVLIYIAITLSRNKG